MRKSAAISSHVLLAASLGLSSFAAHAVTFPFLSGVVINSNIYTVTFTQSGTGLTTFDDVFGVNSTPTLTFTTQADALAAATAVRNAGDAADFNYSDCCDPNGFIVPFEYDEFQFSWYSGWSDDPSLIDGIFGPTTSDRNLELILPFATFEFTGQAVPEPGTLVLLGLGLFGLGLTRRKAA